MRSTIMAVVAASLVGLMSGSVQAGTTDEAAATAPAGMGSAREAGLRYGQAMGVARVCYGLRTTEAAARLEHTYQGADGEAFRAEAEQIIRQLAGRAQLREIRRPERMPAHLRNELPGRLSRDRPRWQCVAGARRAREIGDIRARKQELPV